MILIPNMLTLANLLCGAAAIVLSVQGNWPGACGFVLGSVFLDTTDGWMARKLGRESRFGAFFDSVADFVSFGLAPVFIFHAAQGERFPALLGLVFYVVASAFRLVRFHAKKGLPAQKGFEGLPTTASALIFVGSLWVLPSTWMAWILSLLMISRIPFGRLFA